MKRKGSRQLNPSPFIRKAEASGLNTVKPTVSPHFHSRHSPQWVAVYPYPPLRGPLEVDPAPVSGVVIGAKQSGEGVPGSSDTAPLLNSLWAFSELSGCKGPGDSCCLEPGVLVAEGTSSNAL